MNSPSPFFAASHPLPPRSRVVSCLPVTTTSSARYELQLDARKTRAYNQTGLGHYQRREGRLPRWPREPCQLLGRQQRRHQPVHGLLGFFGMHILTNAVTLEDPANDRHSSRSGPTNSIHNTHSTDAQLDDICSVIRHILHTIKSGTRLPLYCRPRNISHPSALPLSGRNQDDITTPAYTSHPSHVTPRKGQYLAVPRTNGCTSVVLCTIFPPALF